MRLTDDCDEKKWRQTHGGWNTGGIPRLETRKAVHSPPGIPEIVTRLRFSTTVWANHNKISQELPLP